MACHAVTEAVQGLAAVHGEFGVLAPGDLGYGVEPGPQAPGAELAVAWLPPLEDDVGDLVGVMVARDGTGEGRLTDGPDAAAIWKCVRVSPGIDLHMSCDLPKPKPGEVKRLLEKLEAALRRNL
jgi:hypothetical protein